MFVAEKSGLLKVFANLSATTPTQVVDLRQEVDDYWDRGLLGLALDPNFPTTPYVYLLYTYDGGPGQTAPVWSDGCPTPPGPTTDGCVVTAKLVRAAALRQHGRRQHDPDQRRVVPAVPEPLDRRPPASARTAIST